MIKNLFISAGFDFPEIKFDYESGELSIKGRSHPENAYQEYEKVFEWLEDYCSNPSEATSLIIDLEYFNTTSTKVLIKILETVISISDNTELSIVWYYNDADTKEIIDDFKYLLNYDIDIRESK